MQLVIGTPTTKQLVHAGYATSIAALTAALAIRGIDHRILLVEGYDVAQQRDRIATEFLTSDASHLLFIDDDLEFSPEIPLKLISFDKDVVGALCPFRAFDLPLIERLGKTGHSAQEVLSLAHKFAFRDIEWPPVGEICKVAAIGAGMLLISRACFENIMSKTKVAEYIPHQHKHRIKSFFHRDQTSDGEIIPEDWSFCFRWRAIGGEVWAYPFADIKHHSYYSHAGNFAEHLKAVSELSGGAHLSAQDRLIPAKPTPPPARVIKGHWK